jgi:hypothetical protein
MMTHDTATARVDVAAVAELDGALDSARSAFERAVSAVGVVDHACLIGGRAVRLRFAGAALVPDLLGALEHHPRLDDATPEAPTALTIHVWDEASTGVPVPRLAVPTGAPTRSVVARARAVASSPGRAAFEGIDASTGEAWFAVSAPSALTHGERGAPFRLVFHWWGRTVGLVLAHAGAVGVGGEGVLIVGPGGGGKSSVALACVESGFEYAGDDYCFVAASPRPAAFGVYGTGKVPAEDVTRYPNAARAVATRAHDSDEKQLLFVSRALPERMAASLALRAVVVPTRSSSPAPTIEPIPPSVALRALVPSTIAQLPGGAATTMRVLGEVVGALPCFALGLGTERAPLPQRVGEVICGRGS